MNGNEPIDDHDRLVRLEAMLSATSARVDEFVEWKHHQLPPIIMDLQKDVLEQARAVGAIRSEVTALCASVDKLADAVSGLIGLPHYVKNHEDACIRARQEDIEHRTSHEQWVATQFLQIRNRQLALHGTLLSSMFVGMGVMVWYIVTHAHL